MCKFLNEHPFWVLKLTLSCETPQVLHFKEHVSHTSDLQSVVQEGERCVAEDPLFTVSAYTSLLGFQPTQCARRIKVQLSWSSHNKSSLT